MLATNEVLFVFAVFGGSFLLNFISIHLMANLILSNGSSKGKSANLSIQYALLTATIALIGLLGLKILGRAGEIEHWMTVIFVLGGDSGLVFLVKWWYTKRAYETTYLFSFIIVQWIYIVVWMISLAVINFI